MLKIIKKVNIYNYYIIIANIIDSLVLKLFISINFILKYNVSYGYICYLAIFATFSYFCTHNF